MIFAVLHGFSYEHGGAGSLILHPGDGITFRLSKKKKTHFSIAKAEAFVDSAHASSLFCFVSDLFGLIILKVYYTCSHGSTSDPTQRSPWEAKPSHLDRDMDM